MKTILKQIDILHVFLLFSIITMIRLINVNDNISEENKKLYARNKMYSIYYHDKLDSLQLVADTLFQKLKKENDSLKKILEK